MTDEAKTEMLQIAREKILFLEDELARFLSAAIVHATVVAAKNKVDPSVFQPNDMVFVTCLEEPVSARVIAVNGSTVDDHGFVNVLMHDLTKKRFQIGINGHSSEVRLLGKNDGTNVTVSVDGNNYDCWSFWKNGRIHQFKPGDPVKVNIKSRQIVAADALQSTGDVSAVKSILDEAHVEVEVSGHSRVVMNGLPGVTLHQGDKVQLDKTNTVLIRHLGRDQDTKFCLDEEINVAWSDIGGCEEAKEAMIEAIELPYKHPEIYKYYNKKLPKGVLLYGPPGVGKTMICKAAATSLANTFGKNSMSSGFIYVKGPELLNKWVGSTEQSIRELFLRGKDHYKKTGYPALLFIDEAEAILPQRGTGRSSDVDKTIVPMFLGEMDGISNSNVMVILATNRVQMLDPAAIRAGRVDRHIKVNRPNADVAATIMKIHLRDVPLKNTDADTICAITCAELFSKKWVLYTLFETVEVAGVKHVNKHPVYLKDCVNGAMVANLVDHAVSLALKRDLRAKTTLGVGLDDFRAATKLVYKCQIDQNHSFDLEDFIDSNGISRCNLNHEKAKYME